MSLDQKPALLEKLEQEAAEPTVEPGDVYVAAYYTWAKPKKVAQGKPYEFVKENGRPKLEEGKLEDLTLGAINWARRTTPIAGTRIVIMPKHESKGFSFERIVYITTKGRIVAETVTRLVSLDIPLKGDPYEGKSE